MSNMSIEAVKRLLLLHCVPGMAWIQLEIKQPQVVMATCSEPQTVDSDVMSEESGVASSSGLWK